MKTQIGDSLLCKKWVCRYTTPNSPETPDFKPVDNKTMSLTELTTVYCN